MRPPRQKSTTLVYSESVRVWLMETREVLPRAFEFLGVNCDMLALGISLPGWAARWAHFTLQPLSDLVPRSSDNPTNKDFLLAFQPVCNRTIRGPSIVFHRH